MASSTKTNSIFTPYQVERLGEINRFIIRLTDSDIAAAAIKLGYDDAEHDEGTLLYAIAAGHRVPFTHHLASVVLDKVATAGAETKAKLHQVDVFENKWHPRTRNAIRRFVAEDQRAAFEEAFFRDMPQQPEGPGAVDTVKKLLARLVEMKTSTVPGAKEAYESLEKKGLVPDAIASAEALIKALDTPAAPPVAPTPVSREELEKTAEARLTAYEKLNLWYIDWAEVFSRGARLRPVAPARARACVTWVRRCARSARRGRPACAIPVPGRHRQEGRRPLQARHLRLKVGPSATPRGSGAGSTGSGGRSNTVRLPDGAARGDCGSTGDGPCAFANRIRSAPHAFSIAVSARWSST